MSCLGQLESCYVILASLPAEITGRNKNIRGEGAAGEFSASRAIAVLEYTEVPSYLIGDVPAKAASSYLVFGHFLDL